MFGQPILPETLSRSICGNAHLFVDHTFNHAFPQRSDQSTLGGDVNHLGLVVPKVELAKQVIQRVALDVLFVSSPIAPLEITLKVF